MSNPGTDTMTLTVLEDGTAKLEVDGISGANHVQADKLVAEFSKLLGGETVIEKRKEGRGRIHTHSHSHHTTKA